MGFGGVSPLKLTIVLLIIVLIFGTKWLKSLAAYLGGAAKSWREATGPGAAPRQAQHEKAEPDRELSEPKQRSGRA
jgi:TatA/E family protein of Tat protein translocase